MNAPTSSPFLYDSGADDIAIMERVKNGEGLALEELYRTHAATLRAVIFRVLNNDADSDEVLQDVFTEIWNRASTYSAEKGKPIGWIITMARRRALDRVRRNKAYRFNLDRFEREAGAFADLQRLPEPNDSLDRVDTRAVVEEVLANLPAAQRESLRLTFYAGLSQRQIAAKTGIPVGTIKTRIGLGLTKVARTLKRFSPEYVERYKKRRNLAKN
jgi:RNA polymerase sigma-70 factor, ECF subfamily